MSPSQGGPRLPSCGKASFFFYGCAKHETMQTSRGDWASCCLPCPCLPTPSFIFWQLDSKGTPSLAQQWPGGKLSAAQKPAPAHYLPHTKPSHTQRCLRDRHCLHVSKLVNTSKSLISCLAAGLHADIFYTHTAVCPRKPLHDVPGLDATLVEIKNFFFSSPFPSDFYTHQAAALKACFESSALPSSWEGCFKGLLLFSLSPGVCTACSQK